VAGEPGPAHLLPAVVPRPHADTVQVGAPWSPTEVSGERMEDEREAGLVRRVLQGDAGAYAELLAPHLPRAARLAYSQLRDRCRAEDCVQEAAIRGWRRLENLRPGRPFRPWFLAIVMRRCQEDRRSRWQAVVRLADPEQWIRSNDGDWLEDRATGAALRRAFAGLPRDQQVAVQLHLVEDLRQDEVAEIMGITPSNVKSKIHRARQRLRRALEEEEAMSR
jgi:RNA polymerase sigma-70 factor (ECF subfamily)